MMQLGQTLQAKTTNALYEVEELAEGRTDRAIARSVRTGNRVMVDESEQGGRYFRTVTDNGKSGASLFVSLEAHGPRYAMWWPDRPTRSRASRS